MDCDIEKVDEMVLALLYLTMFGDRTGYRAWKGHDWDALDRLHAKGYISDPKSKAKSVVMTEEGRRRSQELFEKYFENKKMHSHAPDAESQETSSDQKRD